MTKIKKSPNFYTGIDQLLPDMQLFSSLHEAGLVRLLQHLLSVANQTTVLQHALVLLHLQNIFFFGNFGGKLILVPRSEIKL